MVLLNFSFQYQYPECLRSQDFVILIYMTEISIICIGATIRLPKLTVNLVASCDTGSQNTENTKITSMD